MSKGDSFLEAALSAAGAEARNRDAALASRVGEVLNAGAGEDHDADRWRLDHPVVVLERPGARCSARSGAKPI
jgi:hypothetical protein